MKLVPFECVFIIAVYNNDMCLQYSDAMAGSAAPSSSATSRSTFVTGVRNNLNSNLFGDAFCVGMTTETRYLFSEYG